MLRIVDAEIPFTIDELVENGAIAAGAAPLFESLLGLLERFGAASQADRVWPIDRKSDLPAVSEVWRLLLAEQPELVAELALIAAAATSCRTCSPTARPRGLTGADDRASAARLAGQRRRDRADLRGARRHRRALAGGAAVARTRNRRGWRGDPPGTRPAGAIRRRVPLSGDQPRRRAGRAAPLRRFRRAGGQRGLLATGRGHDALDEDRFDIILAVHAGARLQLDAASLAALRDLLAPGGLLIAVEPEPNPLWDLVFGRGSEWWRGAGYGAGESPLRSGGDWRGELAIAGFEAPGAAPVAGGPWPISVFWGRAPATCNWPILTWPISSRGPARTRRFADRADRSRSCRELRSARAARARRAPGQRYRSGRIRGRRRCAGRRVERYRGVGEIAVLVAEEGNDPTEQAARLIALLPSLAAAASRNRIPLWIVTTGAQQAAPSDFADGGTPMPIGVVGAAVWGFARVLVNEIPRLSLRLVDFPPALGRDRARAGARRELAAATPETEIVWTPSGRHVLRLRRGLPPRWASPG